jgi:hypothetical protein
MRKTIHFARLGNDGEPEGKTACGLNMYPDTGERPEYDTGTRYVECKNCLKTKEVAKADTDPEQGRYPQPGPQVVPIR